jgi:hypothetical protein
LVRIVNLGLEEGKNNITFPCWANLDHSRKGYHMERTRFGLKRPSSTIVHVKESEAFEQQIHRIHELLEGSEATVTWNDHIPIQTSPSRSRQIDITIKRNGNLTIVECRQHQSPQDVQWIEELIGRRASLRRR